MQVIKEVNLMYIFQILNGSGTYFYAVTIPKSIKKKFGNIPLKYHYSNFSHV